jgi:hypothetical protein
MDFSLYFDSIMEFETNVYLKFYETGWGIALGSD